MAVDAARRSDPLGRHPRGGGDPVGSAKRDGSWFEASVLGSRLREHGFACRGNDGGGWAADAARTPALTGEGAVHDSGTAQGMIAAALAVWLGAGWPLARSAADELASGFELEGADASEAAILQTGENNSVSIDQKAAAGYVAGLRHRRRTRRASSRTARATRPTSPRRARRTRSASCKRATAIRRQSPSTARSARPRSRRPATGCRSASRSTARGNSAPIVVNQRLGSSE